MMECCMFSASPTQSRSSPRNRKSVVDVESAIISVGEAEGPFSEINNNEIQRDERFPIRVTMQYYKATSNGAVNDEVMKSIAEELEGARKWAVAISSLVTETTDRTTEHKQRKPEWWSEFWAQHRNTYSSWTENAALKRLTDQDDKFLGSKLEEAIDRVLDTLGKDPVATKKEPQLPSWDV